jgi:hypothetical protein
LGAMSSCQRMLQQYEAIIWSCVLHCMASPMTRGELACDVCEAAVGGSKPYRAVGSSGQSLNQVHGADTQRCAAEPVARPAGYFACCLGRWRSVVVRLQSRSVGVSRCAACLSRLGSHTENTRLRCCVAARTLHTYWGDEVSSTIRMFCLQAPGQLPLHIATRGVCKNPSACGVAFRQAQTRTS